MAFWSMTSSLSMAGATEKVLDRDSFTLKDLLDCDDILNQVLAPNDRVIRYLSRPEILEELVDMAVAPPLVKSSQNAGNKGEKGNSSASADTKTKEEKEQEKKTDHKENLSDDDAAAAKASDDVPETRDAVRRDDTTPTSDDAEGEAATEKQNEDVGDLSTGEETVEYHEFQEEGSEVTDLDAESDDDFEEERLRQLRYSKVSAEILTTDVWMLLDALLSDEKSMKRLWSVLESETDATPQQLGLLTKIVEGLLEKRLDRMLDFIRTLPKFVDYFIRYIECQPLVDFLIKIISTDHPESPTEIIDFLYEQELIPKMIELLGPEVSHGAQSAAGDFLKAFVNISGGNKSDICAIGPNELSRQFVGYKCMKRLIDLMLQGGHGMCVAVTVIIETIRKNNSDYDMVEVTDTTLESHPPDPRDNIYLGTMVKLFAKAIPQFQEMLVAPETRTMKMPFGEIKPLGFERFRICELYAELLHCSNMNLLNDPLGEAIIQERDAERIRVFFPNREPPNVIPGNKNKKRGEDSDNDTSENSAPSTSEELSTAAATTTGEEKAESDQENSTYSQNDSSTLDADVTPTAEAPEIVTPSSPDHTEDVLTQSPSPPTPENESGDELEYIDDNRQKLNVSNYRGAQLEEFLERENKTLRQRAVVGDQLKFALDDNLCIDAVLDMLFEFPWNNFLHNVVFDIVQQVFNGYIDHSYNKFLAIHLFTRAHLTEKIVKGQRDNEEHEREKKIRLGYVGHLTLISEEVVKFGSLFVLESVSPEIPGALNDRDWIEYVQNDLLQLREQYNTVLGKASLISEEEDSYDVQEEDDRRALALELKFSDDADTRLADIQRSRRDSESDSDNDSGSESESDSEAEEEILTALTRHDGGNGGDDEFDEVEADDQLASDENAGESFTKLSPQPRKHQDPGDDDLGLTEEKSIANLRIYQEGDDKQKSTAKEEDADTDPSLPKDEGEFARYMSRQLNNDHFSSGSSDDDGGEDIDEGSRDDWVPVRADDDRQEFLHRKSQPGS